MAKRGHGPVSRAILNHPNAAVRARASVHFQVPGKREFGEVPKGWEKEWEGAFLLNSLTTPNENYDLEQWLKHLAKKKPRLVARWLKGTAVRDLWQLGVGRGAHLHE